MKYGSYEHQILRILWKGSQDKLVSKDRFMSDSKLDMDKVVSVLSGRSMDIDTLNAAAKGLVDSGLASKDGITSDGTAKLEAMETERAKDVERLGLKTFLADCFGEPDEAKLRELNEIDY